jgi:hypothetical protein
MSCSMQIFCSKTAVQWIKGWGNLIWHMATVISACRSKQDDVEGFAFFKSYL